MVAVNLMNVSKQVGPNLILDTINLSINKGEFIVIVGPSGCGKSSLLRLIAGLDQLSSGKILMNEQCINNIPAAKRDIAMVFQNYALYPHMSVFDNMAYGLKMRRFNKADITKRVTDTAKLLSLTPYLDRKPYALSGGQRQRVAMGRAIVRSPSIFLFDEPLSNLDTKLRTEMRHEIKKLHQKLKTTSLYVTHDQTEAMTMADRVLVLNQGIVEQIGTPQELYQNPSTLFVAGFTGHYPINFFPAVFNKKSQMIETPLGLNYAAPAWTKFIEDNTPLTLAIRPEHVVLAEPNAPGALNLRVEFIDDMGADRFIEAKAVSNGTKLNMRIAADKELSSGVLSVLLPKMKIHVFNSETGTRMGEWCA